MKLGRFPLFATLVVVVAILVMIGLGVWQLQRRGEKEATLALVATNPAKPAISFPWMPPVPDELLFRRSSLHCLDVVAWQTEAGRAADGSVGYRYIAHCSTGAEGPGALVAMGVAKQPDLKPSWDGGNVGGWISEEPDHRTLLSRFVGNAPPLRPMLIAERAPNGLKPVAPPAVDDVPNNHLAYAVQWFLFAAVAALIYALALRRRTLSLGGSS
jgi:cytochrome oxidase assembly protein ShyY1